MLLHVADTLKQMCVRFTWYSMVCSCPAPHPYLAPQPWCQSVAPQTWAPTAASPEEDNTGVRLWINPVERKKGWRQRGCVWFTMIDRRPRAPVFLSRANLAMALSASGVTFSSHWNRDHSLSPTVHAKYYLPCWRERAYKHLQCPPKILATLATHEQNIT